MPAPSSEPRDVVVTSGVRFTPTGEIQRITQYRYFCGPHGPFTIEFPAGQDDPAKAKEQMLEHCKRLAELFPE